MATIRARGERWQAIVRRHGHLPISKTFATHGDAHAWAGRSESEIERGLYDDYSAARTVTLYSAIARYVQVELPRLRGAVDEHSRLRQLQRVLGHLTLAPLWTKSSTSIT